MNRPFPFTLRTAWPAWDRNHYADRYRHSADLLGMVPSKRWCAEALHRVRVLAEALTGGAWGLTVLREPETGAKIGYRFGANDARVVRRIEQVYALVRYRAGEVVS